MKRNRRHRRGSPHPRPGTAPGTLITDPEAPRPIVRVMAYGPAGFVEREVRDLGELRKLRAEWPVTWVNVDGLGDANVIATLGDIFGLHRLALEDVLHLAQRPKVERYDRVYFIVLQTGEWKERLEPEQVSVFMGDGFVITFQERPGDCFDLVRQRIRDGAGLVRGSGADYLTYALLDTVIDHYFPLLEELGERLEALEEEVLLRPSPRVVRRLQFLRRDLLSMRRATWPLRDAFHVMERDPQTMFTHETRLHLRDCYDHAVEIIDLTETYRELGAGLMEVYLSSVSNRMNEIMKVLTIIATIFIPLSFIASVYGMNFDTSVSRWNMPELEWRLGYPFSLGLMACVAGGLLYYFRRKGWLGDITTPPSDDDPGSGSRLG